MSGAAAPPLHLIGLAPPLPSPAVLYPLADAPLQRVLLLRLRAAPLQGDPGQEGPPVLPVLADGSPDVERRLVTQVGGVRLGPGG